MSATTPSVANIIRQQIGVPLFMEMGARELRATRSRGRDGLQFKIKRDNRRLRFVQIMLEPSDTYSVTYCDNSGHNLHTLTDVYVGELRGTLRDLMK